MNRYGVLIRSSDLSCYILFEMCGFQTEHYFIINKHPVVYLLHYHNLP
jgi:hypothetical protein